jgi:ketosteroid isomerase-like protein
MTEESNKVSVRRYFDEVWVRGDVTVLRELFVPGSLMVGAAEANVMMMRPAFSDIRATVDDLVAESDKVAAYVSFSGVNTGPLLGFPPTGKAAVLSALYLFTFENGRIRTMVFETGLFELLMALGLVSPPLETLPPDGPGPHAI